VSVLLRTRALEVPEADGSMMMVRQAPDAPMKQLLYFDVSLSLMPVE
jgi:hypothetical protein